MRKTIKRRTIPEARYQGDLHPVLQRIYAARGVQHTTEIEYSLKNLPSPYAMKNMEAAADMMAWAVMQDKTMLVVGDFDADGATSCALALKGARAMGAQHIDYLVPNRFEYGYGLTPEIVALAKQRQPDLIITVDNGISSHAGVEAAKQAGMAVLVTDHHLPPDVLPQADVIINPNQSGDTFPSKAIAGVGVTFFLLAALRNRLREKGWFTGHRKEPNLAQWLDIVSLGTVADVVPLDYCNRILVAQGLKRISQGFVCPGIQALLQVANRWKTHLRANDLGFSVAPRLNAAGRLKDMSLGIECLLADEPARAMDLATRLDSLNRERRQIEGTMSDDAFLELAETLQQATMPPGLCLYQQQWHQGVIGILASRIKERFHRPVFAFAPSSDNELKGSGRSIDGVHLRDVLDAIAARHPGLITKFGGHAMAAGMSLPVERFESFKQAFETEIDRWVDEDQLQGVILSDGALDDKDMNLDLARVIENAGPWGQHFPEPVFDNTFEVRNTRILKDKHIKLALRMPGNLQTLDGLAFQYFDKTGDSEPPLEGQRVHLAYRVEVNEYMSQQKLQLHIEALHRHN